MTWQRILTFGVMVMMPASYADAAQEAHIYTDAELQMMAGDIYASGELPLGDGHYVLDAPQIGYVYLCHKMDTSHPHGAHSNGPWIHGTTWNLREKIAVQGQVSWTNAIFSNQLNGSSRDMEGNGLPTNHTTGIFPIQENDPAYRIDFNPNRIEASNWHESLTASPSYSDPPHCMGMEVGHMLNGVALYNAFDDSLRDAAAHEVQDSCQGHPGPNGVYHYHSLSSCLSDVSVLHVIGYALDGFPITGPAVAPGKYLTTQNLDVCHGLISTIIEDGKPHLTYHYVMTMDFPYSVSCFRGQPVRLGPLEQGAGAQRGPLRPASIEDGDLSRPPAPPAIALQACEGRGQGDMCNFMVPQGMVSGHCLTPPGQSSLACVPH